MKKKVAMLLSGGVDSSVGLCLLKEQGYEVEAFYLKIWLEDELSFLGECPWQDDLKFVTELCSKLEVPFKVVNLQKDYFDSVVNLAVAQIKNGLTPNPDIFCNSFIKFGVFFQHLSKDFDYVASGHYARVDHSQETSYLLTTKDAIKDQTYFLAKLKQEQLRKILFPLGELTKSQVRDLAEKLNLPSKNRKDSQGLCFLGKINFSDFIKSYLGESKGSFIEIETDQEVGHHNGYWFYTIGQRKGIGLSGGPWYVVKKDKEKNIVYISKNYYEPSKKRNTFLVGEFNWISGQPRSLLDLEVKLRHGPDYISCTFDFIDSTFQKGQVVLSKRDQGITPGQFSVFYQNGVCLGSGMILQEID